MSSDQPARFDKPTTFLCYDPRDPSQHLHDRSTWRPTGNAILITATMLMATPESCEEICWERVAALADLCETPEPETRGAVDPVAFASLAETNAMLRDVLARRPTMRSVVKAMRSRRSKPARRPGRSRAKAARPPRLALDT